jgi:hypothetical protein
MASTCRDRYVLVTLNTSVTELKPRYFSFLEPEQQNMYCFFNFAHGTVSVRKYTAVATYFLAGASAASAYCASATLNIIRLDQLFLGASILNGIVSRDGLSTETIGV